MSSSPNFILASTFWTDFWPALAAGLAVIVIAAVVGFIWRKRRTVANAGRTAVTAVPDAVQRRKAATAQRKHDDLVETVLDVAKRKKLPVVVKVEGRNPAVLTYLSGSVGYVFPDMMTYRAQTRPNGLYDPRISVYGKVPVTVHQWPDERLMSWLAEHGDEGAADAS